MTGVLHALVATEVHPNGLPKHIAALCGARDGALADINQKVTCPACLANGMIEGCVCENDDTCPDVCPCIVCHEELDEFVEEEDVPLEDD